MMAHKLHLMTFQGSWKASTILYSHKQMSCGMPGCAACSYVTKNIGIIAATIARVSSVVADIAVGGTVGNVFYVDATDLAMLYASSKVCNKV
jgi:hypothetical protein